MAQKIPTHYSKEKNQAMIFIATGAAITFFLLIHLIQIAPIAAYTMIVDMNQANWQVVQIALSRFYDFNVTVEGIKYANSLDSVITIATVLFFIVLSAIPLILALALNPYRTFDLIHGDARNGTMADVRKMEERKQVGIKDSKYLHLGLWPGSNEPMRLIETLSCLVLAPPGTGKCLAPHEKVRMADGRVVLNGDLRAGDQLMGPDGKPRNVIQVNRGYGPMYRVTPNKGRSWECNGDHILVLRKANQPLKGLEREITVEQWISWSDEQKSDWNLFRAEMDFEEIKSPDIAPYFVGMSLSGKKISAAYADQGIPVIPHCAEKATLQFTGETERQFVSMQAASSSVMHGAFTAGINASCNEVQIPSEYKLGSREVRLQLLAGIIDTDGSYDRKEKGYVISCENEFLLEDIAFVARSLGFSAYSRKTESDDNHSLIIEGSIAEIPVRLDKGVPESLPAKEDVSSVGFDIKAIGHGPWHGIIIDGDHRFLLDDSTVTHNTATFVVPSIIDTPESSFIVNDPKPELFDLTSGYRAQIGHVFMINWSATDKVDPANLDDKSKTILYPRFNPVSPKLLPPAGTAERDTYLDAVASVMSPSNGKGGGSSDYFEQKGKAALVGFLHYICSKVADADPGNVNLSNIPSNWHADEMEPSIPMLIDMINEGLRAASAKNDQEKEKAAAEGRFHQGDALSDWLKDIVEECKINDYNPRALTEITPLVSMAPNERSGVLGTMDKAFLPFKNAAVRERTSSCDFVPADLRGMPDETGQMKPVTLYVCVNQAEAAAFATITSLLYEVLSREYLAYGPGEINRNGTKLGPYPVCFMLDEFAKLPKIEAVMTGPDLGRSKKTMYCLVAQSDSQIGKLYSKEDQQIIYATTALKYILPQNDKDTIKLVQDMVGPTTIKRSSSSKTKGGDFKEMGKSNQSTNLEKVDFIRPGDISGMEPGKHIILAQGFMNRPYFMDSVYFFKDPDMLSKVYNPRTGLGPQVAYPLPEQVRLARIEEWKRKNKPKVQEGASKRLAVDLEKYEDTPEPITA